MIVTSFSGIFTTSLQLIFFASLPDIETITLSNLIPAVRTTLLTTDFIEFEANSIFVIEPFFSPWDLIVPIPITFIVFSNDLGSCSTITAQICVEPISIPKILVPTTTDLCNIVLSYIYAEVMRVNHLLAVHF